MRTTVSGAPHTALSVFATLALLLVPLSAQARPIHLEPPSGWISESPATRFRVYQYRLPAPQEGLGDARLVVYHFGRTDAGGIEANLARWRSQMQPGPDDPAPKVTRRKVAGREVVILDQRGTYTPGFFSPGDRTPKPGWRMVAAIVPSEEGSYFIQALGPAPTVEAHRKAIDALIASVRIGPEDKSGRHDGSGR